MWAPIVLTGPSCILSSSQNSSSTQSLGKSPFDSNRSHPKCGGKIPAKGTLMLKLALMISGNSQCVMNV